MPKRFLRKWMPSKERIRENRFLRIFGSLLYQQNLWHLNRDSVARAFAIGVFWASIPMPFQMVPAAGCAIFFRATNALSVALVWLTNPITMPPVFYAEYLLGTWLLGTHVQFENFSLSWEWIKQNIEAVWKPLYLGAIVTGVVCSAWSDMSIYAIWRWHVVRTLQARRLVRIHHQRLRASRRLRPGHAS